MIKQSLLILLCLVGCSPAHAPLDNYTLGKYQFGYVVGGKEAKAITQVFDDGTNTFLQLAEHTKTKKIKITQCNNGKLVKWEVLSSYIAVSGTHKQLCATFSKNRQQSLLTIQRIVRYNPLKSEFEEIKNETL